MRFRTGPSLFIATLSLACSPNFPTDPSVNGSARTVSEPYPLAIDRSVHDDSEALELGLIEPDESTFVDTDRDGLWDHIEIQRGLDPNHRDTDRDGIEDHWDLLGAGLVHRSYHPSGFGWFKTTVSTHNAEPIDRLNSQLLGIHLEPWTSTGTMMVFGTATGRPMRVDGAATDDGQYQTLRSISMDLSEPWQTTRDLRVRAGMKRLSILETRFSWELLEFILDADGEEIRDVIERKYRTPYSKPTRRPPTERLGPDTDADALFDADEALYGTNPFVWDTDGDGAPDGLEVYYGHDPLNPDTDGDGILDMREYLDGTAEIVYPPADIDD
jgi:hypothetical protein